MISEIKTDYIDKLKEVIEETKKCVNVEELVDLKNKTIKEIRELSIRLKNQKEELRLEKQWNEEAIKSVQIQELINFKTIKLTYLLNYLSKYKKPFFNEEVNLVQYNLDQFEKGANHNIVNLNKKIKEYKDFTIDIKETELDEYSDKLDKKVKELETYLLEEQTILMMIKEFKRNLTPNIKKVERER